MNAGKGKAQKLDRLMEHLKLRKPMHEANLWIQLLNAVRTWFVTEYPPGGSPSFQNNITAGPKNVKQLHCGQKSLPHTNHQIVAAEFASATDSENKCSGLPQSESFFALENPRG